MGFDKKTKTKNKKIRIFLLSFFGFLIFILAMIYNSNNKLEITYLNFENQNAKNKIKIVHVSDLHQKSFGRDNKELLNKIKKQRPDLILITGDLVSFSDENMKIINPKSQEIYYNNLDYMIKTLKDFASVSKTYFVLGNHEMVLQKFDLGLNRLKTIVKNLGVSLLINEIDSIKIKDTVVNILGTENSYYQDIKINKLVGKLQKKSGLKIILDHYPTDFALNGQFSYMHYDIDYVFSGHEHGGQVRVPFVGGIVSHEEGFFPKYSEGVHVKNNATLVISRGLGNSSVPIRLFNRPQLIVVNIN